MRSTSRRTVAHDWGAELMRLMALDRSTVVELAPPAGDSKAAA